VKDLHKDAVHVVRQLRWIFTGLALSGVRDWPAARIARRADALPAAREGLAGAPSDTLSAIRTTLGDCARCRLHKTRTHLVFGEGSVRPPVVFVGEAPGFEEDRQGRPFVGRAGKLLDRMIQALGLRREEVYIGNVVKCRPPQNRNPDADEIAACSPFLLQQLEALQPRVICALGNFAAQTLLRSKQPISQLRGRAASWHGIPLVVTFHPAYLLRNPAQKASVWEDLKRVLEWLGGP
jgi:DNA polymerase